MEDAGRHNGGHYNGDIEHSEGQIQQSYDLDRIKKKNESVKGIQKTLEEVMGIFQRISTMVQMHEVMIERYEL